jgi:uncharacterized protein (UPF0333 family)
MNPWRWRARLRAGGCTTQEAGQAYLEFLLILPLLLALIAGILYFGRVLYAKIAVDNAAYDCVRTAAEAMQQDGAQGRYQGETVAINTLEGFYLNRRGGSAAVAYPGSWGRGQEVACQVRYNVSLGGVPFVEWLDVPRQLLIQSTTHLRVEEYKSQWKR